MVKRLSSSASSVYEKDHLNIYYIKMSKIMCFGDFPVPLAALFISIHHCLRAILLSA